ncbi:hypothetical protein [Legionella jordanis]|nr:hypothetical protein [Legionella jordanis]
MMGKYALAPIVFYESHADRSVTNFIVKQLPLLKKAGYKALCIDGMEVGASLTEKIRMLQFIVARQSHVIASMSPASEQFRSEIEKMRSVYSKLELLEAIRDNGLELIGFDLTAPEQMRVGIDSLEREQFLVTQGRKAVEDNDGAVLFVLGFGHATFQQLIEKEDLNARQYLWFHIKNPAYETQAYEYMVKKYEIKGYRYYFPLGVQIMFHDEPQLELVFWDKVSAECYNYEQEELQTVSALRLKDLFGDEVSSYLRADGQSRVDALVPLKSADPGRFFRQFGATLMKLGCEVQAITPPGRGEKGPHVIIRDINSTERATEISSLSKCGI